MKKVINYKVEGEQWTNAQDKAFEKLNKTAKIDGFRPGHAPKNMFIKKTFLAINIIPISCIASI